MKTVVNVYKDAGLWRSPPPGIGDYLRGCCYLVHASTRGEFAGQFDVRFNLDLAPAANLLSYEPLRLPAPSDNLVSAPEFFSQEQKVNLADTIRRFLASSSETLFISTNQSWRGVDDEPTPEVLDRVSVLLKFSPAFEAEIAATVAALPARYSLLHVRDCDRGQNRFRWAGIDERRFRSRATKFVSRTVLGLDVVCISNNERLRDHLCRHFGLANARLPVGNTGYAGVLSRGELMEMALIRDADSMLSVSYYPWNSGFAVWGARLFETPGAFYNKTHLKGLPSDQRLSSQPVPIRMPPAAEDVK